MHGMCMRHEQNNIVALEISPKLSKLFYETERK